MSAAIPNVADWVSQFGGLSEAFEDVPEFCPVFANKWDDFCHDFATFLDVRFGSGALTGSLSVVLKDFHDAHPGYRLAGCVVQRPLFKNMGRAARDCDLQYLNPDIWYRQALSPGALASMSDAAFERRLETFAQEGLALGGLVGVVWEMTEDDLKSLVPSYPRSMSSDDAQHVIYTLGLVDMDKVTRIIVFDYTRDDNDLEPCPRTPTPIDGLGNALFWPIRPCARKGGQTRSFDGNPGRPEAVHGRAVVSPPRWLAARKEQA